MSWTILSVSYPLAAVSEDAVGGAEQVLAMLDRALVEAGHRSLVIAPQASRVKGQLIPLPPVPETIDDAARNRVHQLTRQAIAHTLAREHIDVVHFHGIDFPQYLPSAGPPVLVTLHLPLAWYPPSAFLARPRVFLQCVSASQAETAPPGTTLLPPIPNGVDLDRFHVTALKRNYALFLGRICPEKGVDIALNACRAASIPLLIGGQVYPYPEHQRYFREQVEPLLDTCRRFLGPLALSRKAALLAAARCVLIPSLAAETSSLVAMEALASGTPVIAFRSGALPEIVTAGRTGFLVNDAEQMAAAIYQVNRIEPAVCRDEACRRFGTAHTISSYFQTYARISEA